jgi:hypothetical protein
MTAACSVLENQQWGAAIQNCRLKCESQTNDHELGPRHYLPAQTTCFTFPSTFKILSTSHVVDLFSIIELNLGSKLHTFSTVRNPQLLPFSTTMSASVENTRPSTKEPEGQPVSEHLSIKSNRQQQ